MYCSLCSRRGFLLGAGAFMGALSVPRLTLAQERMITDGVTCAFDGPIEQGEFLAFAASDDAKIVVADIARTIGLTRLNFNIYADPTIPNAGASLRNGERIIRYNENFMKTVINKNARNWAGFTVMAHEVGHHLLDHTRVLLTGLPEAQRQARAHEQELEADEFAATAVRLLEGDLAEAIKAYDANPEKPTRDHPARAVRVTRFTESWNRRTAKTERYELVGRREQAGQVRRVVCVFKGQDRTWEELDLQERKFASYREVVREPLGNGASINLHDASRSRWVKIEVDNTKDVAVAFFANGEAGDLPSAWAPLDPARPA